MTLSQRRVLRQLRDGPRTAGAVADALDISGPALTRHVTRLEERGLIEREVDQADRRRVLIDLTAAGGKVLADHRVFAGTPLQAAARRLTQDERHKIVASISRLVALAREERADD